MRRQGDRQKMKRLLRELLKALQAWANKPLAHDLTYEQFLRIESKKTKTPLRWMF